MKRGFSKKISLVLGLLIIISLCSVAVIAQNETEAGDTIGDAVAQDGEDAIVQDEEDALAREEQGNCEDYCNDFWSSAMPSCPGDYVVAGTYPDCSCDWICDDEKRDYENEDLNNKPEEDSDYRCEDMNQQDCESAEDCESIWGGPSFCEGEACTADTTWKGCRYQGDKLFEGYESEELKQSAGTTPGSLFYFIDKFFDKFGDEIKVKEERIAEIKAMVEAGDIESAKIALKEYMDLADKLEQEIDPERKEDAKRSAAAIRNVMKDIKNQIPEGERGRFVSEIMGKENKITAAGEIAAKIKVLCEQLAELDPMEYSKMCKTDDDAPAWKKKLDKDLSAEQEKTAKEFVDIMKQCFKSSGQDCRCDEIPFYDFSIACSKAAPLATACDINGDDIACDELDNLKMPELPDWLQPIWVNLEMGMKESQYDMHMPSECVEEGATTPKECGKIMIKIHAPLECKAALLEAEVSSEKEGREICDKIMFEKYAPQECINKGINNPKECARFMDSFRGDEYFGPKEGPGFGEDCSRIEDSMKRLECYDNKGNEMGEYYGPQDKQAGGEITWQCKENRIHWAPDCDRFMREEWPEQEKMRMEEGNKRRTEEGDWRIKEKECAAKCEIEQKPWDFTNGQCICKEMGYGGNYNPGNSPPICDDCANKCPIRAGERLRGTGCGPNGCECYYESEQPQYGPGEGPGEGPGGPGNYINEPPSESGGSGESGGPGNYINEPPSESGGSGEGSSSEGTSNSGGDNPGSSESGSIDSGGNSGITGEIISDFEGNGFLNYFFSR